MKFIYKSYNVNIIFTKHNYHMIVYVQIGKNA